jgi:hypothetical protein
MHGLTGGGWKRKRYRPRLKRKLPAGKPRPGAPRPTAGLLATAPAPDPPMTTNYGCSTTGASPQPDEACLRPAVVGGSGRLETVTGGPVRCMNRM